MSERDTGMPAAEAETMQLFASKDDDAEGLLAFALHRRAMLDWLNAFAASAGRAPNAEETRAFLIGETAPRRVQDYRDRAALMIGLAREGEDVPAPAGTPAKTRMIWPFGPGMGFTVDNPGQPVNWRQLMLRLLMLMGAVIVTALLLRVFVVSR